MDYNLITSVVSISDHFAESDFIYWHYFLVIVKGISVFLFYFWVTQQRSGGCAIRTVFTLSYKSTYLRFWRGRIHGPDSNLQSLKANPLRCMFMSFFSFFLSHTVDLPYLFLFSTAVDIASYVAIVGHVNKDTGEKKKKRYPALSTHSLEY